MVRDLVKAGMPRAEAETAAATLSVAAGEAAAAICKRRHQLASGAPPRSFPGTVVQMATSTSGQGPAEAAVGSEGVGKGAAAKKARKGKKGARTQGANAAIGPGSGTNSGAEGVVSVEFHKRTVDLSSGSHFVKVSNDMYCTPIQ